MMYDVSGLKFLLTSRGYLILSAVNKDVIMNAVNKSKYFEDWYADTGTAFSHDRFSRLHEGFEALPEER